MRIDSDQKRTVIRMAAVVAGLHLLGFLLLFAGTTGALTIGVGLTAYTLGLRHAFDADHIAAIDGATRKLVGEGRRPLSVGFFFSLGHATIVFALTLLLALGVHVLGVQVEDEGSMLHEVTGWIGAAVSGSFLYLLAALNFVVLLGLVRARRELRSGEHDGTEVERLLEGRGLMNRLFGRLGRVVARPWQMYPLGFLFGLGFDTATEVALLFLAAGAAGAGLPFYAILCLPLLFAAGMVTLDTLNGSFMSAAYGWANTKPERKLDYNLTITALSVALALVIGTFQLAGLAAEKLGWNGGVWGWLEGLEPSAIGFLACAGFALIWLLALTFRRARPVPMPPGS